MRQRMAGWSCLTAVLMVASLGAAPGERRLADAAKARDLAAVRLALKERSDVNGAQGDGATALHWAAHWGDQEMTALLIRAGANVNVKNSLGVTPLSLACAAGHAAVVKALLAAAADPNLSLSTGETPLMTAARTGNVEALKALLVRQADPNAKERTRGQTALMWAAAEGHPDAIRTLVEAGAELNATSSSGFTPLLFAAWKGDQDSLQVLIDAGADVNKPSEGGLSPLLMATIRGFQGQAEFLMDRGADVNNMAAGFSVLHWVAGEWETELTVPGSGLKAESSAWSSVGGYQEPAKLEFVKKLVARGADVNALMTKAPGTVGGGSGSPRTSGGGNGGALAGATPYYLAAQGADAALMRYLKDAGADPKLNTRNNRTPLMAAVGIGRSYGTSRATEQDAIEAATLAIEAGADINAADNAGDTALHAAAYWGHNALVQFLVDKGASIDPKNKMGNTPYMIATGQGPRVGGTNTLNEETAALLGKLGANTDTSCEWPCLDKVYQKK